MDSYLTFEFDKYLDLFDTSSGLKPYSSSRCNAGDQFQIKIRKVSRRGLRSSNYAEFGHFASDGYEMFKD